jgi:hypothetical protein
MVQMEQLLRTPKKEFVVVNAPPGGGKSTLFTHDLPCWLTARSRTIRGFIGSAAQTTANSYTGQIRSTLESVYPAEASSEEIEQDLAYDAESCMAFDYGRFKPLVSTLWQRKQFTVEQLSGRLATGNKESTWCAWGADSLFLGWRVNFIMWDDLVTDDMVGNIDRIEKQRRWWSNTAERRLEPGGVLVLQGQRMYADDLYKWCLELDIGTSLSNITEINLDPSRRSQKKYKHIIYKAHYEEKCQGEFVEVPDVNTMSGKALIPNPDHGLHGTPHNPDGTGGCLLDPTRISYDECMAEEAKPFSQYRIVFQQEDVDPAQSLVHDLWVNGGKDPKTGVIYGGCKDYDRDIAELPPGIRNIRASLVTVDPSPTRYWSVQWWVYVDPLGDGSKLEGTRYLMDHYRGPMMASQFLDWNGTEGRFTGLIEEWWQRCKEKFVFTHLIVEANGAQRFMLQYEHFRRWSTTHSVIIIPHETGRNKSDPNFGIGIIQPQWRFGRVRLPYHGPEARAASDYLINEVTRYPNALTDDALMAHWFHEYQLQHVVVPDAAYDSLYDDMPSWARSGTQEHRLLQLIKTPGQAHIDKLVQDSLAEAENQWQQ